MLRKASIYLTLIALAALCLPAAASAATVSGVKAAIKPIPGFPETGDILGAGALIEIEGKLEGTEFPGGLPAPTRKLVVYFPAGTKIDAAGFPTCTVAKLEQEGPEGCPAKSRIANGTVGVADQIGSGEATREEGKFEIFVMPGNGVVAYANAASPISAQIVIPAYWETAPAPYGPKLTFNIPLVESVPGAPPVSGTSIHVKAGAAIKKNGKTYYYGRVPAKCPKGGFPGKGEVGLQTGETITTTLTVPCP
ncbi:MAG: hypothetical protein ACREN3_15130, partial [Gemmatimonadaceae bacterium]